uniref:Uncharacterized protein n=1 Tax=Anguilla anguilla TaxID=7936 RepID=A0A0E9XQX6_ANGAN
MCEMRSFLTLFCHGNSLMKRHVIGLEISLYLYWLASNNDLVSLLGLASNFVFS